MHMDSQKFDAIIGEPCSYYDCFCSKMTSEVISEHLISEKFPGEACPQTPLVLHAYAWWIHIIHPCNPPSKTPSYGPVIDHYIPSTLVSESWLPSTFWFSHLVFLAVGLWALHDRKSLLPVVVVSVHRWMSKGGTTNTSYDPLVVACGKQSLVWKLCWPLGVDSWEK